MNYQNNIFKTIKFCFALCLCILLLASCSNKQNNEETPKETEQSLSSEKNENESRKKSEKSEFPPPTNSDILVDRVVNNIVNRTNFSQEQIEKVRAIQEEMGHINFLRKQEMKDYRYKLLERIYNEVMNEEQQAQFRKTMPDKFEDQ